MNQNFMAVQKAIRSTPGLAGAQLLSISFDPDYDTPEVLKATAQQAQADPDVWRFATAELDEVMRFANRFGLTVSRNESPALVHNLATAVIDAEGRLAALYSNNRWTPSELVAALTSAPAASR
jgi:protein SCO1/2